MGLMKSRSPNRERENVERDSLESTATKLPLLVTVPVSLFLCWHIAALLCEPLRMFSQSSVRPMGANVAYLKQVVGPYMEFMYLDHGYFFFAPNPGPSHLMRCEIRPKGAEPTAPPILVQIPDRTVHWPRLDYHRHFMLSEFYHAVFTPSVPPPNVEPGSPAYRQWERDLAFYRMLQNSVEHHLEHLYPESKIEIKRLARQLPNDYRVLVEGWKIDDDRLLEILPDTSFLPSPQP